MPQGKNVALQAICNGHTKGSQIMAVYIGRVHYSATWCREFSDQVTIVHSAHYSSHEYFILPREKKCAHTHTHTTQRSYIRKCQVQFTSGTKAMYDSRGTSAFM